MIRVSSAFNYFLRPFQLFWMACFLCAIPVLLSLFAAGEISLWYLPLVFAIWVLVMHSFINWMYASAAVWFSEEGVWCRVFLKKRFYPWKELPQAGIWWNRGANYYFRNQLVLLLPGGSRRRYRDKTFRLRNPRTLLTLPATDFNQRYVISHYGPLDFNLTDGEKEQGIVVEYKHNL